ncbi:hypothetical protein POTOM_047392 [Populus tomentosa]|uniref:Uncharacterized protein n=1 Tax=Populus tomentosa TaxID=118781 RepID=A0A8X7YKT8_POPTO|nr:hypothetical protein POTOM_047392 [Populus tomentosa]
MANKKKKSGSHRLQTKQQASQLVNDRSVLALAAPPLPHTVHVTVPLNSNPPHISPAPVVVPTSVPVQVSPNHGEHSPSINHIFEDDYFDDEEIEEEADLGFYREDHVNRSKFFTTSPLAASTSSPPVGSQIECPTNVIPSPAAFPVDVKSPTAAPQPSATSLPVASSLCAVSAPVTSSGCAMPAHDPAPGSAMSVPIVPMRGTSPSANPPSNVPSKPRAKESAAPDPNITKGRDTAFNRLGPQGGTSVAGCSEANQPANCGPNPVPVVDEIVAGCSEANQPANCGPNPVPVVDEIVPANGTTLPNNGGWELVRRKKARSKSSQSRISSGSTHATPRVGQENSHISPPPSIASADVAGHRADKGKSVVMPIATGQLASQPLDIPIRRKIVGGFVRGQLESLHGLAKFSLSPDWLVLSFRPFSTWAFIQVAGSLVVGDSSASGLLLHIYWIAVLFRGSSASVLVFQLCLVYGGCGGGGEGKVETVGELVSTVVVEDGGNPMEGTAGI